MHKKEMKIIKMSKDIDEKFRDLMTEYDDKEDLPSSDFFQIIFNVCIANLFSIWDCIDEDSKEEAKSFLNMTLFEIRHFKEKKEFIRTLKSPKNKMKLH